MPNYLLQNQNLVHKVCNSQGLGPSAVDYLIQRCNDHVKAFEKLSGASNASFRYRAVTETQLQQWWSEFPEATGLFESDE